MLLLTTYLSQCYCPMWLNFKEGNSVAWYLTDFLEGIYLAMLKIVMQHSIILFVSMYLISRATSCVENNNNTL
jgi:glycerol-3-phosphate acyltransferase PlsY